jgi:hypothetical protein
MLLLWLSRPDSCCMLKCCEYRRADHDHDDPKSTVKSVDHPGDVSSRLPVLNDFVDDSFL